MKPREPHVPQALPDISDVVSSTECTGLIPAQPADGPELDASLELFSNALPRKPHETP